MNAGVQYELVQAVVGPAEQVHARVRKAYGTQYATVCGSSVKVRLVMLDPFRTLYAQLTCATCRRQLDGER